MVRRGGKARDRRRRRVGATVVRNAVVGMPLPAGTTISVYNGDAQLLYTYTTAPGQGSLLNTFSDGPTVVGPGGVFNTGHQAFAKGPVYLDYTGGPTATFYPGS